MQIRTLLYAVCALLVALSVPLVLKRIPRNSIYGFRTVATLARDDIWYRANVFAGWALIVAGLVSAAVLAYMPSLSAPAYAMVIAGTVGCATLAALLYVRITTARGH